MPAHRSQSRSTARPAKEARPVPAPADETIHAVRRGEASRARLVEVAYQLFCQKGFHGTSLRDIAEEAGVAVGGIYNHFKGKDDIFAAVLGSYYPFRTIFLAIESLPADTVEDYVYRSAHIFYDNLSGAGAQLLRLILIELVEFQGRHFQQQLSKFTPFLLKFVGRLDKLEGRLRPVEPQQLLSAYRSLIIGMALTDAMMKNQPLSKSVKSQSVDGVIDIFLHGILEPE